MMMKTAIFAGVCFWGMQDLFRKQTGVEKTVVGYIGGGTENPNYDTVKNGDTGHAEALKLEYDPEKTSYRELLMFFFQIHDPTTPDRQGNDTGSQYRSAIFYLDQGQKETAETVIEEIENSGKWPGRIVTTLEPAAEFTKAEEFHQDYLKKHPAGYTCHFSRPNWKIPGEKMAA